jgi:hypothetical protein
MAIQNTSRKSPPLAIQIDHALPLAPCRPDTHQLMRHL